MMNTAVMSSTHPHNRSPRQSNLSQAHEQAAAADSKLQFKGQDSKLGGTDDRLLGKPAVPKNRLSFGEELDDDSGEEGPRSFDLSASTTQRCCTLMHRYLQE